MQVTNCLGQPVDSARRGSTGSHFDSCLRRRTPGGQGYVQHRLLVKGVVEIMVALAVGAAGLWREV
eukprot:scaffold28291_cov63-Phaeocystis_antarctica.AAC.4